MKKFELEDVVRFVIPQERCPNEAKDLIGKLVKITGYQKCYGEDLYKIEGYPYIIFAENCFEHAILQDEPGFDLHNSINIENLMET